MSQATTVLANEPVLQFETRNGVAILSVNRPKALNALNADVVTQLEAAIARIERDASIHGVILTGAGDKSFIAGADIGSMANLSPVEGRAWGARGQALLNRIEGLP